MPKQIGVKVDETLKRDFRSVVQHRENAIRGELGKAYEKAMKLYIANYFISHPDEYTSIRKSRQVENPQLDRRIRRYIDETAPEVQETCFAIQRTQFHPAARGNQSGTGKPHLSDVVLPEKDLLKRDADELTTEELVEAMYQELVKKDEKDLDGVTFEELLAEHKEEFGRILEEENLVQDVVRVAMRLQEIRDNYSGSRNESSAD